MLNLPNQSTESSGESLPCWVCRPLPRLSLIRVYRESYGGPQHTRHAPYGDEQADAFLAILAQHKVMLVDHLIGVPDWMQADAYAMALITVRWRSGDAAGLFAAHTGELE